MQKSPILPAVTLSLATLGGFPVQAGQAAALKVLAQLDAKAGL